MSRRALLGLSGLGHDPAACLIVDGQMVAAVEEERLNRQKHTMAFPHAAIDFVLREGGVALNEVEIAYYWDDRGQWSSALVAALQQFPHRPRSSGRQVVRVMETLNGPSLLREELLHHTGGDPGALPRIHFVPHHLAHLAAGCFSSERPVDAALVVDGRGEYSATSLFGGPLRMGLPGLLEQFPFPNSLGVFFGACAQVLGCKALSDEYKVMGLASWGRVDPTMRARLARFLRLHPDGRYTLNIDFLRPERCSSANLPWLSDEGRAALAGAYVARDGTFTEEGRNFAYAAQSMMEEALVGLLRRLCRATGARHVTVVGGVAMNAVAIGRMREAGLVDHLHVPLAPTDAGACIGAALYVLSSRNEKCPDWSALSNPFQGPGYSEASIESALRETHWPFRRCADPARECATSIRDGRVVGWFDSRMEFGERALGARSILGDPRFVQTRDRINASVKRRESFRPLAPAILEEDAPRYFATSRSRRMGEVVAARELARKDVPAVVHIDGTARPQTVPADWSVASFRRLIEHFRDTTGIPMVINTSFNLRSEPIVCSPEDAIRCFAASGLDELFIGPFALSKADFA